jgi:glycosyltransferase involved in cell wall biosynthesis
MFSIVIPLFNKEKYIYNTITSVLNQSFISFEIIIINDGSTDNSLEIINKIKDDRIIIITTSNSGVSHSRNLGIQKSKFEFIAFLDADDLWHQDYLKIFYSIININPNIKCFFSNYTSKNLNDKSYDISLVKSSVIENYFKVSIDKYLISSSSIIINKYCFNNVGLFNTNLSQAEDIDMWLRLIDKYTFVQIDEDLVLYNTNTLNNSSNNLPNIKSHYAFYIQLYNISKSYKYYFLRQIIYDTLLKYLYNLKIKEFLILYWLKVSFKDKIIFLYYSIKKIYKKFA